MLKFGSVATWLQSTVDSPLGDGISVQTESERNEIKRKNNINNNSLNRPQITWNTPG
jgi:hypothetical protein